MTAAEKNMVAFVNTQLSIHARTSGLKTMDQISAAMAENKAKWIKMFILASA